MLSACAVNNNEVDGPVFCSIDQTDTYELGTSPAGDFNVTNLSRTRVFNGTDCPNINTDSFTTLVSRAKRVDDELQIFVNQYQIGQFLLEMQVSGTDLQAVKRNVNISNCSIVREWDGTLNTAGTTITINELVTYRGACQSTFYNPDLDTTNPGS